MTMQPATSRRPPPSAPSPADPHELLWAERSATGLAGPLLVATQTGGNPEGAIRLAELLARRHLVDAHVIAVARPTPIVTRMISTVAGMRSDDLDECRRATEHEKLRGRVSQLVGPSGVFSVGAELGEFTPTVAAAARRRDSGYVLTELAPAGNLLRASSALAALRLAGTSERPVLAVPAATARLPRSALVCTDFTEAGTRAALAAAPLLADDGELTLVHIASPLDYTEDPDWVASWTLWATTELRATADRLTGSGRLRVYILLLRGNARNVVLRSARNFDLVALGAPADDARYLSLGRGLLGAVLRHTPTTVLIAPNPARNLQIDPACPGPPAIAAGSSTR